MEFTNTTCESPCMLVVVVSNRNLDYCETFLGLYSMSKCVCVLSHHINVKMLYLVPNIKRTHSRCMTVLEKYRRVEIRVGKAI